MFPLRPSTESSKGRTCTRLPYLISRHWWTLTRSPSLTRRLFRATLFIWMRPSSTSSELKQMRTVSRLFFPLFGGKLMILHRVDRYVPDDDSVTAKKRKQLHRSGIKSCDWRRSSPKRRYRRINTDIPELSSAVASSTIRRLGLRERAYISIHTDQTQETGLRFLWP